MPQLPSGRYVDIMAERARYHARRRGLRIHAGTPHQQLYPLIDILVDPTHNSHGCRGCTTFSGYTLADRAWINEWQEGDRRFFLDWLREESQVRAIEQARTRLLAERATTHEELHDYPSRLYSSLRRRIEALPQPRATAEQWRHTLNNMCRKGLRREELEWARLPEFLDAHDEGRVDREALLDAIDLDRIVPRLSNELECESDPHLPFTEQAQRIPAYQLRMAGYSLADDDVGVVRLQCVEPHYRVGVIRPGGRSLEAKHWFVLGPYGKPLHDDVRGTPLFSGREAAVRAAEIHARRSHRLRPGVDYSRTYEYMSLYGGEDYREWLVTLPDYHRSHFTAHYHERNILLHIRTKIRESVDGTRVLFVEELQSDWHQALARHGSRVGIPPAPFRREWAALGLKLMLMHVVDQGLDGIAWADAAVHELRYDREMVPLERLYDRDVPNILKRLGRPWGAKLGRARFDTRSPWLHAARCNECWKVEGGAGKFSTRPRYDKQEALALIERHSKAMSLELPLLRLSETMRRHIAERGLPLFGLSCDT